MDVEKSGKRVLYVVHFFMLLTAPGTPRRRQLIPVHGGFIFPRGFH